MQKIEALSDGSHKLVTAGWAWQHKAYEPCGSRVGEHTMHRTVPSNRAAGMKVDVLVANLAPAEVGVHGAALDIAT